MSISSIERQNQIVQLLFQNQRISVAEICTKFEISKATACRDLETLVSSKKIQRVHGGAIPLAYSSPEIPMLTRREEQAETKRRIGQAAAKLVRDGDTVVLGSGSTVLQAARSLDEHRNLTVITNSLPVMNLMTERSDISLVSVGGMLLPTELCFIGHIAELALEEVRADKAIIGVRSINLEQGLTSDYLPEVITDRALLRSAQETIIVADHTKFGRISTALLIRVEKVQTIITDAETPRDFIIGLQERGIRVIVV
jgi:DeoR/GlpR family transcriptional regulator of sugar metabolism